MFIFTLAQLALSPSGNAEEAVIHFETEAQCNAVAESIIRDHGAASQDETLYVYGCFQGFML